MIKKLLNDAVIKLQTTVKFSGASSKKVNEKRSLNQDINVFRINGADFVTGLVWNTISNPRGIMSEARRFGRDNNMDVVAIRESLIKAQAGYVGKNKGVNKEMYSLASSLAGILEVKHSNDPILQQKLAEGQNDESNLQSGEIAWLGVFEIEPEFKRKINKVKKAKPKEDPKVVFPDIKDEEDDSILFDVESQQLEVIKEETLYYILAVVEGNVVPQSDRVGTRSEIEKIHGKINGLYGSSKKFHRYYFPKSWLRSEPDIVLRDLLNSQSLNKSFRLKQLTWGMTKRELVIATLIFALICSYVAYDRYQAHLAELEFQRLQQEESARIALQRKRIREATGADVKVNDLVKPWVSKPTASEFIRVCDNRLADIAPYIGGGWQLIKIDCQEKNIKLDYVREIYSTIDDFRRDVKAVYGVEADIPGEGNGNRGYVVIPNKMNPGGNEEPGDLTDLISAVASQFQRIEAEYSFKSTEVDELPKLPGQTTTQGVVNLAPWSTTSFVVKSDYKPEQIFSKSRGSVLRIESIVANISDDKYSWSVMGKLYDKN
jgi:Pilin accessory protein (PilO).